MLGKLKLRIAQIRRLCSSRDIRAHTDISCVSSFNKKRKPALGSVKVELLRGSILFPANAQDLTLAEQWTSVTREFCVSEFSQV